MPAFFSLLILVMGVSPVLAPLVGGQILAWFNWRVIYWVLMAAGTIGLVASAWRLPETHRPEDIRSLALRDVIAHSPGSC